MGSRSVDDLVMFCRAAFSDLMWKVDGSVVPLPFNEELYDVPPGRESDAQNLMNTQPAAHSSNNNNNSNDDNNDDDDDHNGDDGTSVTAGNTRSDAQLQVGGSTQSPPTTPILSGRREVTPASRRPRIGYYLHGIDETSYTAPACQRAVEMTVDALRRRGYECVEFTPPSVVSMNHDRSASVLDLEATGNVTANQSYSHRTKLHSAASNVAELMSSFEGSEDVVYLRTLLDGEVTDPSQNVVRLLRWIPACLQWLLCAALALFPYYRRFANLLNAIVTRRSLNTYLQLKHQRKQYQVRFRQSCRDQNVDVIIAPPAPLTAFNDSVVSPMSFVLCYTSPFSLLDVPCGVVPVTTVTMAEPTVPGAPLQTHRGDQVASPSGGGGVGDRLRLGDSRSDGRVSGDDKVSDVPNQYDYLDSIIAQSCADSYGLPVGVQVLGQPFEDETCLAVMKAISEEVQFDHAAVMTDENTGDGVDNSALRHASDAIHSSAGVPEVRAGGEAAHAAVTDDAGRVGASESASKEMMPMTAAGRTTGGHTDDSVDGATVRL
eukprot:GFYU01005992.1.p1 GENE.GFYU01005992.1~~GFYU01005992.1.p1  ORF type:complete len:546 (-),score=118.15 GFYU01005992.1:86-1723(-)